MNYYIIYLLDGLVTDICSWDDEAGRDDRFALEQARAGDHTHPWGFNTVQKFNQVR